MDRYSPVPMPAPACEAAQPTHLGVALPWLTLGAIAAISLLVQPVKFMTPGLMLTQLVAVGSTVFHASHVFQWVMLAWMIREVPKGRQSPRRALTFLSVMGIGLLAQTLWLTPELDARLGAMQAGRHLTGSSLHAVYVGIELAKLIALLALACQPMRMICRPDALPKSGVLS